MFTVEQISDESQGEVVAKALGLKTLMMKFATFFGLKLGHLVFSATEKLSSTLQTHDINAQQAISAANATKHHLQPLQSQSTYETFYKGVITNAKDITDEPILPRE